MCHPSGVTLVAVNMFIAVNWAARQAVCYGRIDLAACSQRSRKPVVEAPSIE